MTENAGKIRVDKWLWQARFFKTRSLSAKTVSGGHLRLNGQKVLKPAQSVTLGDVLLFAQGRDLREVKVVALGTRRGPAPEARLLYDDLAPPEVRAQEVVPSAPRYEGGGRPTKRDRRQFDLNKP